MASEMVRQLISRLAHMADSSDAGVTVESLSKLKPAFSKDGTTHAGNASQVSDGAAAVLLARRSTAKKLGLPILGKFVTAAVVGVPRESIEPISKGQIADT